ncbi:hypothetical protein [Aliidiomarina minuta]|nr:hypothetical protein [Aliidiomarina minuta]
MKKKKYGLASAAALYLMSSSALAIECELSAYLVDDEGELGSSAIINPADVKNMSWSQDDESLATWRIELTEEAGEQLLEHSKAHIGQSMALFCDAEEIERMRIMAPLGAKFMIKGLPQDVIHPDRLSNLIQIK